jgi:hypothetical protein
VALGDVGNFHLGSFTHPTDGVGLVIPLVQWLQHGKHRTELTGNENSCASLSVNRKDS